MDAVFELLANQRRRFGLYSLSDSVDGEMQLETLVEDVATLEAGLAKASVTREHYLEVASDFHHWHLEVLGDVGIAEVEEGNQTVRYHGNQLLETWLNRIRESELSS